MFTDWKKVEEIAVGLVFVDEEMKWNIGVLYINDDNTVTVMINDNNECILDDLILYSDNSGNFVVYNDEKNYITWKEN